MPATTSTQRTPPDSDASVHGGGLAWRLHVIVSPDRAAVGGALVLGDGRTDLGRDAAIRIDDPLLSRRHAALVVSGAQVRVDDCGSRNGSFHGGRRITSAWAGHGAVLRFGHTVAVLEADLGRAAGFAATADVPGDSEAARMLRGELDLAARATLPALLIGETGTGKEHAAVDLHRRSGRRGALVRFNVAAVPHNLFESELFGHVAGAFTGASGARVGRVREAQGGSLVLDEIGELPEAMQAKLLRMLEEDTVRPLGGNTDLAVDVRFIASTNADLVRLARTGRFRQDLLARLRGQMVHLPRVAERLPDLLQLADAVAPLPDGPWHARLTAEAAELLLLHAWPDNLRELRAVLQRAHLLAGHAPVAPRHLPEDLRLRCDRPAPEAPASLRAGERPSALQLRAWLAEHGGNIDAIARRVQRHRRQVYRWLQYAGVGPEDVQASRQAVSDVSTPPDP